MNNNYYYHNYYYYYYYCNSLTIRSFLSPWAMVIDFRKKDTDIMPLKIGDQIIDQVWTYKYLGIEEKLHCSDHINNIRAKANKWLYFVRKLGQFKVDRTLITFFYKSIIESILSFCITYWGGHSSNKKTLDKIISISKDVKHPLHRFLNKSKSNRIDGYSHIMTKTEPHLKSFLPSAIRFLNDTNYNFSCL